MGFLARLVIGWGVPEKFAKPFVILMAIALLAIAIFSAVKIHDHRVIANANLEREKDQAVKDRAADNAAAEQRDKDNKRRTDETQELKDVQVKYADPNERKRAFYRCIRLQQDARRNGLEPPACV